MIFLQLSMQALQYSQDLSKFLSQSGLSRFSGPIDHFGVKTKDANDYESTFSEVVSHSSQAQYIELNGRKLGTAKLVNPFDFGEFGSTSYVEILQPRPEKVGKDIVGLEHAEMITDLDSLSQFIAQKNLTPKEIKDNGFHKAISFTINSQGQEIKFTGSSLEQILENEKKANKLIVVK